jgi:dipeptidyl-peptidase-4
MKALLFLLIAVHALTGLHAEPAKPDPAQLTLARIFTDKEFDEEKMPSLKWSKKSASYFTLEKPIEGKDGKDLVQNHVETGKQTILASAKALTPKGEKKPLTVDSFEFNADESKALLFTHTKKVWRKNTRGDYWLLDLATKALTKLGGDAAPRRALGAHVCRSARRPPDSDDPAAGAARDLRRCGFRNRGHGASRRDEAGRTVR